MGLVRYLHLNPLRPQVVSELRKLDRYLWTGHSALLGTVPRPWQATALILGIHPSAISKAARRGATAAAEWQRLLRSREES